MNWQLVARVNKGDTLSGSPLFTLGSSVQSVQHCLLHVCVLLYVGPNGVHVFCKMILAVGPNYPSN